MARNGPFGGYFDRHYNNIMYCLTASVDTDDLRDKTIETETLSGRDVPIGR